LKERYEYMTREKGMGKTKAIAAAARRLGELMYTILKKKTGYGGEAFDGRQAGRGNAGPGGIKRITGPGAVRGKYETISDSP
jgi:hypothetical protein